MTPRGRPRAALVLALIATALSGCGGGATPEQLARADSLFRAGRFGTAEDLYRRARAPDVRALTALGRVALFGNRLDVAAQRLRQALGEDPAATEVAALLAEVHYRRDEFARAAPLFRRAGREAMARKLESFGTRRPYELAAPAGVTHVQFVATDPLPVVRVSVNHSRPVFFLIDTGAGELIIDTEFAAAIGVRRFGAEESRYAGDQTASYVHGAIDSLTLGDLVIHNLPVQLLPTRRFAAAAGGRPVDGIIGTVLLYHFRTTLDYAAAALVLRPRATDESTSGVSPAAPQRAAIPFWMAGDHFMVAWGAVNASQPLLWLVDTGLAGNAFTCPSSTVREAGIELAAAGAGEGIGGGGRVRVVPFRIDSLRLGPVTRVGLTGLYGPFPESLEYRHGFRIGGLISHAFFRPYAVTFDFAAMQIVLERGEAS